MITSPEFYYEEYLKGKSEKEILLVISDIKKEINRLKNAIEHPDPNITEFSHPTDSARLLGYREYLKRAKQELEDIGGTYIASNAEKKALLLDDSVHAISKISFSIGSYCQGYETQIITVCKDRVYCYIDHSLIQRPSNLPNGLNEPCNKTDLISEFRQLHLGEWNTDYYNQSILDGMQWELTIEFSNGHAPFKSSGSNAYPFNFEELLSLLRVDLQIRR